MTRRIAYVLATVLVLFGVSSVSAQGVSPRHSEAAWQVSYWDNKYLSGSPAATGADAQIDWNWGVGSPHVSVGNDHFSVRWQRLVDLAAGRYRFTTVSDDGIRVYVDERLVIDAWTVHPAQTHMAEIDLTAGHHQIVVEYFENEGQAVAQFRWTPVDATYQYWRADYFSNRVLFGSPAMTRDDKSIDFNWGGGSPGGGIGVDDFSVRWTRAVDLPAGNYRFTAVSDDGIRVYVDNRLVIDQWYEHPARTFNSEVSLSGGRHQIVVEYFEAGGLALARLSWQQVTGTIHNWRGEYFNNITLSGTPDLVRDDGHISFDWGFGSPAGGIRSDGFSARWTRQLEMQPGMYQFTTRTDDGVRLWVNGHLLIDRWRDQAASVYRGQMYLAGSVEVKMEYFERAGQAVAQLSWYPLSEDPPQSGTGIVVDDAGPGFVQGGSASGWRQASEGYEGRLTWTRNNETRRANYNWARWYPNLSSGRYEVYVYVPDRYTTTTSARYWVSHRDGYTLRIINQSTNGGRWVSLGTYDFRGTDRDYVSLSDITNEPYLSRLIAFDAVKWERR